jgi:gas vesicle protein
MKTDKQRYNEWYTACDKLRSDSYYLPFKQRKEVRQWIENIENMLTKISMLEVQYRRRTNNHSLEAISKIQNQIDTEVPLMVRKVSKYCLLALLAK